MTRLITRDELLSLEARQWTERQLQDAIIEDAKKLGVRFVYHTWNSKHSEKGMPDLTMLHDGRMVVAELKRERKDGTAEQVAILHQFGLISGARAFLWRPSDYLAGRVADALLWLVGRS